MALAPLVRLSQHVVELDDGHRVGVATAGSGVPLVVVHGFGVESLLYAQPLARLAALGFRVVAIDVAGHGATQGVGMWSSLADYRDVLVRAVAHLGVRRAVFAGHSFGGRIVMEVAAVEPERVAAALLLDAIVGAPWDRVRTVLRWSPPALAAYGGAFALDLASTVPLVADPGQAMKLGSRAGRSIELHVVRPWRAVTPGQAILRAGSSLPVLARVRAAGVYVAVVHGDRDLLVPLSAGRDTARRVDGDFVVVHHGGHSWLLRCPETLPAIVGELMSGRLGATLDDTALDGAEPWLAPDSRLLALGAGAVPQPLATRRRTPRYSWTVRRGGVSQDAPTPRRAAR
jgi:pimeloyl-ACP methyl ester carboxylesterase